MNDRENRKRAGILLLMAGLLLFMINLVLIAAEARYLDVIAGLCVGIGLTLVFFPDVRTP